MTCDVLCTATERDVRDTLRPIKGDSVRARVLTLGAHWATSIWATVNATHAPLRALDTGASKAVVITEAGLAEAPLIWRTDQLDVWPKTPHRERTAHRTRLVGAVLVLEAVLRTDKAPRRGDT